MMTFRLPSLKFVGLASGKYGALTVSAVYLQQFPSYSNHNCKKSSFLRTPAFIFCLPWGRPCGNHAKRCINEMTIQCLSNPSQYVPICLEQFPSYSNRKFKKIAVFTYRSPHFCFSWKRPCDYHAICCMGGKTVQCLLNLCSMYLSIFNSFRVIRCLIQWVSPKIAILLHFCFPWGRPWGDHAKCCMDGKRIRCLQIVSLHVWTHLSPTGEHTCFAGTSTVNRSPHRHSSRC